MHFREYDPSLCWDLLDYKWTFDIIFVFLNQKDIKLFQLRSLLLIYYYQFVGVGDLFEFETY